MKRRAIIAIILVGAILLLFVWVGISNYIQSGSMDLATALIARNYAKIIYAAEQGCNLDQVWIEGHFQNPIVYLWQENPPRPCYIKLLLDCGANANYADAQGVTLLMRASGYHPQVYGFYHSAKGYSSKTYAQLFLQYGADVNQTDRKGKTAVDYAVRLHGNEDVLTLLLSYGGTVTPQTLKTALDAPLGRYNYKTLQMIVGQMSEEEASRLLEPAVVKALRGDTQGICELADDPGACPEGDRSLVLFYAAAFCDSDCVVALLDNGWDTIDALDGDNATLLYIAAKFGNTSTVRWLLQQKSWDEDVLLNALSCAVDNGHVDTTAALLDCDSLFFAQADNRDRFGNLMDAPARRGDLAMLNLLIEHGYPVTQESVWDTMKSAAQAGCIPSIQYFMDLGFSPAYNEDDTYGDTSVLCAACLSEQIEVVRFLITEGKCNVNAGQKCLPYAANTGNAELVALLLGYGAEPNGVTRYDDGSQGDSAADIANNFGFSGIVDLLKQETVLTESEKGDDISQNSDINE